MSEKLRESLSAAMDGEADEFELRRVMDEAGKDRVLRDTWERYHLVSAVLAERTTDTSLRSRDALRTRIWEALDYELAEIEAENVVTEIEAPVAGGASSPWMGRAVGFAVAFGVAAAVLFGSGVLEEQPPGAGVAVLTVPDAGPDRVDDAPALTHEQDLTRNNAYVMHHVQQTGLNAGGMLPFVKMVTFEKAPEVVVADEPARSE